MKNINNKLELIDAVLNDDNALNIYIKDIEQDNIKTPKSLENNILKYIKSENKKANSTKFKMSDIIKIAACTILSVSLWEILTTSQLNIKSFSENYNNNNEQIEESSDFVINANDIYRTINKFMFKPIHFERSE